MLARTSQQLEGQGLGLELTPAARSLLAERGYDPQLGARPLRRAIQQLVEDPLSERILWKEFRVGETIVVDVDDTPAEGEESPRLTFRAVEGVEPPPMELAGSGRPPTDPGAPRAGGPPGAGSGYDADVVDQGSEPLIEALALVAPGTPLRDGLDRILQAKRGALVVVGDDPVVLSICTGGFLLDAEFSPQRLSELAKMDGAIILASDASRIARANVHLVPKASIPTSETGTRHRTAERVARSIDVPVVTVSEAMATVTVFRNDRKHTLQRTGRLVDRAAPGHLDPPAVQDPLRPRPGQPVHPRGRGRGLGARRGRRPPARRDGGPHRRGDRRLPGRAGRGRPAHPASSWKSSGPGLDDSPAPGGPDYVAQAPARGRPVGPTAPDDGGPSRTGGPTGPRAALHGLAAERPPRPGPVAAALGLGAARARSTPGVEARGYRLLHRLPRVSDVIIERIVDAVRHPAPHHAGLAGRAREGGRGRRWPRPARSRTAWPGWSRPASSSATTERRPASGPGRPSRVEWHRSSSRSEHRHPGWMHHAVGPGLIAVDGRSQPGATRLRHRRSRGVQGR